VLSKGHAAPILYSAWAEAGIIRREDLLTLRLINSDLEGHPTPRLPWVDVATGSLGQGLCAGVGIALNARRIKSDYRTYVLLGDGETAEGSVWEAADVGAFDGLDSLCAITDVNGLGQSGPTQWNHNMEALSARWKAFGWHALVVDGHDVTQILDALDEARRTKGRPTMILARTIKGKGISFVEGKNGWHGKAFKKGEELDKALAELRSQLLPDEEPAFQPKLPRSVPRSAPKNGTVGPTAYKLGDSVATREAYGDAIARLGASDDRIVALDGDVKNSTFSEKFEQKYADRFYEVYIAEQAMIGAAMGLASRGAIPFPSTFAAFLTRAYDFIRMAAISNLNIKMAGSHAGVSIGEDGASQMALEDLAMMRAQPNITVLYPCDGVSTEKLIELMAYHPGPAYMRTSRPKTPVIYGPEEKFEIGGLKVLRESSADVATVIGAGVTVFEALKAYDELKKAGVSIRVVDLYSLQPIDAAALLRCARDTKGRLITVEDHYAAGGIGDAVAGAVASEGFTVTRMAVAEIPRSGKPDELIDRYGISARRIVEEVRATPKRR
jgi:transketolase